MPKLNINSLHEDEDVLHYSQLIYFYERQSRYLFNKDWLELAFKKANCIPSAEEYSDSIFPL